LNLLLDFLKSRRSLRWLGHLTGLLAGAGLLLWLDVAWPEALQGAARFAGLLLGLEICLSLLDFQQRRLKHLAPTCFPLKNMEAKDRAFVQASLAHMPSAVLRRSALAWVLAFAGVLWLPSGPALFADAMLLSLALPVSALVQALGAELLLKRVLPFFYFDEDYAKNLRRWLPGLGARFRGGLLMPLTVALAPLAAAFALGQPLGAAALLWIGAWAFFVALGGAWAWGSLVVEPLEHLQEALRRFGKGDLQALLDVTSGDELGHATETYNKTLRAVDRRLFVLENFGHAVLPAKSEALFEGGVRLDGELRPVAVLECAWHNLDAATASLDAPAKFATMNRFYEVVQDAVDKAHGSVLVLGQGRVLACWGAPLADEAAVQGALAAAWSLQAQLKVWASQQRLRGSVQPLWGLGVASGQATVGLLGPRGRQRYSVLGGPVAEVQRLAQREAGPWVDERSAGAARAPFAVQIGVQGPLLCAGPEPAAPSAADLGFKPGERL
jgi:adenylate cyclase